MSTESRRPTPRPVFDRPVAIPASDPTRHIWGDSASGFVLDRVYLSSQLLHVLEFLIPPGGGFGHSRQNPTIFAADELLYVLDGVLLLSDPSTGETRRASAGEAVFFRRDTWHHGRPAGDQAVRVLEFFAPTPATGASSVYGRAQPYLEHVLTVDPQLLGGWPMMSHQLQQRLWTLHEQDLAWGTLGALELAFFAATEHLTVLRCHLRSGAASQQELHSGEEFVLLLSGGLVIMTPTAPDANCLHLETGDAAVLPPGTPHSYLSTGENEAVWLCGIGPGWRSINDITPQPGSKHGPRHEGLVPAGTGNRSTTPKARSN